MELAPCLQTLSYERLTGVLLALFLLSILYALVLTWAEDHFGFVSDYTWLTVVVGVGYSLAGLAILSWQAAVLALAIFAVTGVPIVARSIYLDAKQRRELRERLERRF